MSERAKHEHIKKAHELEGDTQKIRDYYRAWSKTYDADVAEERYLAPHTIVKNLLAQIDLIELAKPLDQLRVLDAGCGTGLVGEQLRVAGFTNIVGFDLSIEMVERAAQRRVYDALFADIDLTQSLSDQISQADFDVTICVGVFTHGHVPPTGLNQLLDITQPDGLIAINARETYAIESGFEDYCQALVDKKEIRVLSRTLEPSTGDTDALFLIFQRI